MYLILNIWKNNEIFMKPSYSFQQKCGNFHFIFFTLPYNHHCIQSSRTCPSISYDHRVSTPPASCPAQPTPSILFLCVQCVLPNCRRSENTVTDDLLILVTAACTIPAPHPSTRSPRSARTIDTFLYFHSMSGFTFRGRSDFTLSKNQLKLKFY